MAKSSLEELTNTLCLCYTITVNKKGNMTNYNESLDKALSNLYNSAWIEGKI